ncbi:acetylajmalan esterase-like isoform X2 [Carica papaya]|uniref:acetylajmalan esterase-like isoform X2 n=1 Tax=Carica papaya TaxID=3649 RepID=UPI000B8D0483|nr:acetylajmalan esterase-like isoform X2 [Carica papaya]
MASVNFFPYLLLILVLYFASSSASAEQSRTLRDCKFEAIYQLGDSIADTGNLIRENFLTLFARLPYGESFFKPGTGRCSNGLLMIDFIAQSAGLPLLEPYLDKSSTFDHGVNFAVAGATALPTKVLAKRWIFSLFTKSSLNRQVDWMDNHFSQICENTQDCGKKISNSLFMVGEIGGNDYNYALLEGHSVDEVKTIVPEVVQVIKDAVKKVIGYGATRIVVSGNFPIGCVPIYLTSFETNDKTAYDDLHCLKELNDLAAYHNQLLQHAIEELGNENTIMYGDYYNAYQRILRNASSMGFDPTVTHKSCCGSGGDYNFNFLQICGLPFVPVCSNPDVYVSFDGVHSTQKTYSYIAEWLIGDMNLKFKCNA